MKKYLVLYHAPMDAMKQMGSASPDEQKKGMEMWMEWAKRCGDKLVDLGAPLTNGQQVKPDGGAEASTKNVVGYSILQAESMDDARELLKEHPHLGWNADCSIEVHETMPIPGM